MQLVQSVFDLVAEFLLSGQGLILLLDVGIEGADLLFQFFHLLFLGFQLQVHTMDLIILGHHKCEFIIDFILNFEL